MSGEHTFDRSRIAVVTINPTRRGVRVFDPAAIDITWKEDL